MFNQRSAFDEALSRPLVPAASDERSAHSGSTSTSTGGKKKKKKQKKGNIGTSGRGFDAAPASGGAGTGAATGRLPSFGIGPSPNSNEGYAPPSAVSSVVSEDDAPQQGQATTSAAAAAGTLELEQEQRQQQHESLDEALLRERNSALAEVARNMGLVHTIQRELSTLVDSQQEDIDDIEANAIEVHESTERGVEQLERARGYMRDGCGTKCGRAVLTSVGATSVVAAVVFWLLAK